MCGAFIPKESVLEIKRTSITRLKQYKVKDITRYWELNLKSKEPRLRDWNLSVLSMSAVKSANLKSKEPRLRDWNSEAIAEDRAYLTLLKSKEPRLRDWNMPDAGREPITSPKGLEIKRTSITRLKPEILRNTDILICTWNQKNLDYEIETASRYTQHTMHLWLEIKRTSITRLKRR